MIRVNLLREVGGFGIGHHSKKSRMQPQMVALVSILVLLLSLGGTLGFFMIAGVPSSVKSYLPENLLTFLAPSPVISMETTSSLETSPTETDMESASPEVLRERAVEEIVRTVRPDLFVPKVRREYRKLLPMERVHYQKQMVAQLFEMFLSITPKTFGFSDLAYKIPDYYYARGMGADVQSKQVFLDTLHHRSLEFKTDEVTEAKPSREFTVWGRLKGPEMNPSEKLKLVPTAKVAGEIEDLAKLGSRHHVKFRGLRNPRVSDYGLYRRFLYRATTNADFIALEAFTQVLKNSPLRVGILQVSMIPNSQEGMQTSFDFVIYSAAP